MKDSISKKTETFLRILIKLSQFLACGHIFANFRLKRKMEDESNVSFWSLKVPSILPELPFFPAPKLLSPKKVFQQLGIGGYLIQRLEGNPIAHNTIHNTTVQSTLCLCQKFVFLARRECLPGFCLCFGGGIDEFKIDVQIYNKIIICETATLYFLRRQSNVNLLDSQPHKIFLSGLTQL